MNPENTHHSPTPAETGTAPPNPQFAETAFVRPDTSSDGSPPGGAAGSPQSWVGKTLGKYQVNALLGQGAMGVVIKARDPLIERDVAIKVLAEHLAADATSLSRFLAEARAAGKINHVNVIAIHEILQDGQMYYLVLEYVGGGSLSDKVVKQGPLTVAEATRVMIDACKGVGAAHAAGVIHRDIKPANLMQSLDGAIKVADFGLAKTGGDANRHFTQTGVVMGTPFFMSPEQCEAKTLDPRSDLYSLGATYYSLLTGKHPFQDSDSVPQLMYLHCHGPIPDPRTINPAIPEACSRIVARAMAKAPVDRYQSANEMLADLQVVSATLSGHMQIALPSDSGKSPAKAATGSHPVSQPPAGVKGGLKPAWIAAAVVGLAAVVALIVMFGPFKSPPSDDGKGGNSGATPAPPVVAAGEIVLGMSAPFSGATAELGREMEIGIDTYFEHINAEGGIAGRKLKLVPLDDGYEPEKALANMHELYDKHKAFAIIGNVGTPTALKTLPFALEKQMIFFGAFTGAPQLRMDPPEKYVFNVRASYEEETAAMFSYLVNIKKIKPEQIAVFAQQDGYGDAGFRGVSKTMRKHGGDPDKILRVGHERNKTDVNDAVQKIAAATDIAAVIMVSTYRPASLFIQKVKDARAAKGAAKDLIFANVSFVGSNALADELIQMGPKYAEGVIVTQVVPHINSQAAAVSKYRELLAKYHPNAKPNFVSLEGYLDAVVLVEGLKRAGKNLTSDSVVAALESINNLDLGIGAPIHYGPSEHQASHKVWGTVLDSAGKYQVLELD